jgi:hypothetical protein
MLFVLLKHWQKQQEISSCVWDAFTKVLYNTLSVEEMVSLNCTLQEIMVKNGDDDFITPSLILR